MTQGETWEKLDKDSCNWTIEPQLLTLHLEKVNRMNPDIKPQETPRRVHLQMAPTNQPWPDLIIKAPRNGKDALDTDAQIDPKSQVPPLALQWRKCAHSATPLVVCTV